MGGGETAAGDEDVREISRLQTTGRDTAGLQIAWVDQFGTFRGFAEFHRPRREGHIILTAMAGEQVLFGEDGFSDPAAAFTHASSRGQCGDPCFAKGCVLLTQVIDEMKGQRPSTDLDGAQTGGGGAVVMFIAGKVERQKHLPAFDLAKMSAGGLARQMTALNATHEDSGDFERR